LSIPEIIERVRAFNCRMVEITGGEPLIHEKTPDLVNALVDLGHAVLLETNGSLDISRVNPRCIRIVDFKCPSSGEAESNRFENMEAMFEHDEIKFVVADREDYEYARDIIQHLLGDLRLSNTIHLSPVFGKLDPAELASWILEDRLGVRLSLQLHKYIWHPDQRGV
jgi:7-carboxy-7-deazaguanine synthase